MAVLDRRTSLGVGDVLWPVCESASQVWSPRLRCSSPEQGSVQLEALHLEPGWSQAPGPALKYSVGSDGHF